MASEKSSSQSSPDKVSSSSDSEKLSQQKTEAIEESPLAEQNQIIREAQENLIKLQEKIQENVEEENAFDTETSVIIEPVVNDSSNDEVQLTAEKARLDTIDSKRSKISTDVRVVTRSCGGSTDLNRSINDFKDDSMASLDDSQPVIQTRNIVQNLISEVAINNLKPEKQNSTREVKSQAEVEPGRDSDSTGHFFESKRRADKSMSAIEERTEKSQSSSNCITKSLETANFEAAAAYQSIESSQKTIPQVCAFDVDQPSVEKILHNGSESLLKDISQNNV